MKTVIEMAREARIDWNDHLDDDETNRLDHFAELVRADERNRTWTQEHWTEYEHGIRNATLDEIANKIEQDFKGAFGADTCASWAAWIRNQK